MHPLNYMRLHDQSSGNPRQYWTNVSNGKIRLLRWVAHGQLLRLYIWSFLVSILAKIAPFLPSKNQISDLPSKMSEPCVLRFRSRKIVQTPAWFRSVCMPYLLRNGLSCLGRFSETICMYLMVTLSA